MRNREIQQAQQTKEVLVWRAKKTADENKKSTDIGMVLFLPSEFRAPDDQKAYLDFDGTDYEEMVARLVLAQQAIFDKPDKHHHLKALYIKGFV